MAPEKDCIFCGIRDGAISAQVVLDEANVLAFLDKSPLFFGHVLVVPKTHYLDLMECPPDLVSEVFLTVQRVASAVKVAMGSDGAFIANNNGVSQSVPHLHIHVVPRKKKDGLRGFMWPRRKYESDDQANEIAQRISDALSR